MAKIVNSAKRALDILELFAKEQKQLSMREISEAINAPVTTCVDLVYTLAAKDFLVATPDRRAYFPTGKLYHLGQQLTFDAQVNRVSIRLDDLAEQTDETCMLTHYVDGKVIVSAVRESSQALRYIVGVGERIGLHCTASGKCFLDVMETEERDARMEKMRFLKATKRTLTNRDALLADIAEGRKRGWHEAREEAYDGLMSMAVPVSIHERPYAITLCGPVSRIEEYYDENVKQLLRIKRCLDRPPLAA